MSEYHMIPPNMMNNRAELSRLLESFGLALVQTMDETEEDVRVTLSSEGALVLASALFEVVNQMRYDTGIKHS